MRVIHGLLIVFLAGIVSSGAGVIAARATIQPEECIAPDIEYPVPCDEDDDDGGDIGGARSAPLEALNSTPAAASARPQGPLM